MHASTTGIPCTPPHVSATTAAIHLLLVEQLPRSNRGFHTATGPQLLPPSQPPPPLLQRLHLRLGAGLLPSFFLWRPPFLIPHRHQLLHCITLQKAPCSYRHLHLDLLGRVVANDLKVLRNEVIDLLLGRVDAQRLRQKQRQGSTWYGCRKLLHSTLADPGQRDVQPTWLMCLPDLCPSQRSLPCSYREVPGRILQLLLQGVHVVGVHVGVAHDVHKLTRLEPDNLHAGAAVTHSPSVGRGYDSCYCDSSGPDPVIPLVEVAFSCASSGALYIVTQSNHTARVRSAAPTAGMSVCSARKTPQLPPFPPSFQLTTNALPQAPRNPVTCATMSMSSINKANRLHYPCNLNAQTVALCPRPAPTCATMSVSNK